MSAGDRTCPVCKQYTCVCGNILSSLLGRGNSVLSDSLECDTLRSENAELRKKLEEAQALETALCVWIQDKVEDFFGEELSDSIAEEVMAPLGYFERVPYDPDKHGDIGVDPGDEIWHFTKRFELARARLARNEKP